MMPRSAPSRVQSGCVSTRTGGRPGPSSLAAKPRPSIGDTPSTSKMFGDAVSTEISAGSAVSLTGNVARRPATPVRGADPPAGLRQFSHVRAREPAALQIEDGTVVAPHEIEIVGILVRHRRDQDLLDDGVDDREHADADGERRDARGGGPGRAPQAAH